MVNIIEELQNLDIPHTSYMRALRHMQENFPGITPDASRELVKALTGVIVPPVTIDDKHITLFLMYVIQEAIRESFTNPHPDPHNILDIAREKTFKLVEENPWMFVEPEEEEKFDELTGKPKMKKGKKQELAAEIYQANRDKDKEEIMELFQKELDMSKSGARTYYYNMRNKFGDNK
jgi:hypothetical protein